MLQDFRLRALEGLVTQKLQQQSTHVGIITDQASAMSINIHANRYESGSRQYKKFSKETDTGCILRKETGCTRTFV
jgi:hypothetical protein